MILKIDSFRETLKNTILSGFGRSTNMVLKCLGFIMFVVTTLSMVFLFHWYINKSNAELVRISSPTEYTTITVMNEPFINPEAEELKMDPATRALAKRSIPDSNKTTAGMIPNADTANETFQSRTNRSSAEKQPGTSLNIEITDKTVPNEIKSEPSKNCTSNDPQCISSLSGIIQSSKDVNLKETKFKTEYEGSTTPLVIIPEENLANKSETNDNSNTEEQGKLKVHINGIDKASKVKDHTLNDAKTLNLSDPNAMEERGKGETKNCTLDWNYVQQIEDYLKKYEETKQKINQDKKDLITPGKRDATVKKDRAMLLVEEQSLLENIEKNLTALLSIGNFGHTLEDGDGELYPSTEISFARTLEGTTNNDDPLNVPTLSTNVNYNRNSDTLNSHNRAGQPNNIFDDKNLQSNSTDNLSYSNKEDKSIIPKAKIDLHPFGKMAEKSKDDHLGSKLALKELEMTQNNTQNILENGTEIELNKLIDNENSKNYSSLRSQTTFVHDDLNLTHPRTTETSVMHYTKHEQSDSSLKNDEDGKELELKSKNSILFLNNPAGVSENKHVPTSQSGINLHPSSVEYEPSSIQTGIENINTSNKEHEESVEESRRNITQQNKTASSVADTLSDNAFQRPLEKVEEIKYETPSNATSVYKKREITTKDDFNRPISSENFFLDSNRSLQIENSSVEPLTTSFRGQIPQGSKNDSNAMDPFNTTEEIENKLTETKAVENMAEENNLNGAKDFTDIRDDSPRQFEFYEINNDYDDGQNYETSENNSTSKSHLLFDTNPRVSVPNVEMPASKYYENKWNNDIFEKEPIKSKLTSLIDRIIFQRENIKKQIDESERTSNDAPSTEEDEEGEEKRKIPCKNIPSEYTEDEEYETMIKNLHDVHFNDEQNSHIQRRKNQFKRENTKEKRKIKTVKQSQIDDDDEVAEDEDLEEVQNQLQVASNKLKKRKPLLPLKNKIKQKDESNQAEDEGSEEFEDSKILNPILGKKIKPKTIVPPSVYKKPTKLAKPVKPDVKSLLNKYKKPAKALKYAEKSEEDFSDEELNENGLPDIVYIPFKNSNDLDVKSLLLLSNALSKGDKMQNHFESPQLQESVYSRGYDEHQPRLPETGRLPSQYENEAVRRAHYNQEPVQYSNDPRMRYSRDPVQYISNEPEYHQYDHDESLPERTAWLRKRKTNADDGEGVARRRSFLNLEEPTREIANLIKSIQELSSQFKKS